ncbi:MAG: hypothetical protein VCB42_02895 [Myxococcota bacterium]
MKGSWRSDHFEYWLVLALIVGFLGQALFMSFSYVLFDTMFDAAHTLKTVSYVFVLIGLLISTYHLYRQAEESREPQRRALAGQRVGVSIRELENPDDFGSAV